MVVRYRRQWLVGAVVPDERRRHRRRSFVLLAGVDAGGKRRRVTAAGERFRLELRGARRNVRISPANTSGSHPPIGSAVSLLRLRNFPSSPPFGEGSAARAVESSGMVCV